MFSELWLSQRYLRAGKKEKIISITALISVIGIAIGVMVLIVVISVMTGFDRFLEDKMVGTNAHVSLEFYGGLKDHNRIIDKLKTFPYVAGQTPFIDGQALVKNGKSIFGVEVRGIDPKLQAQTSKIDEYLKLGSYDLAGNEVALGQELVSRLGLGIGDSISLISPVTLTKTDFSIKGIFNSGMYLYDSSLILTSIKGAQDFYKMPDTVSGIAIKVDDVYKVDDVKEKLYRDLKGFGTYQARTWIDANKNFLEALKLEKIVMFIVVTMTTVVAAFGIVGTLIMSVMSRIKDIGILRSVGAKTKSILQIFVYQGMAIGLTGIILGLIGGITLALSLDKVVDLISHIIGRPLIPQDIYYFNCIPVNINIGDIGLIVVSALLITLFASIYPAYYATRIIPSEAVRHE
ncbi:MAG: lipoprotein-releasing system transmembrane subunit LolC [Candidatus Omnitrophica bacterium CG11_big_fil_rev_8_21_14_0_20_41_12]|nr:MAG: lipoprotein-releasing system transmembrane subunit LolC [Candidatus Omnitrophica bacterium CG11_big_fil_rev_8_21_14_0_20_41_12]